MYISDKDALTYTSKIILLIVPFVVSYFSAWSWIIEILLLFAVFIHRKNASLRTTAIFLAVGYVISFIPLGLQGAQQIGLVPWAGLFYLWQKERITRFTHREVLIYSLLLAVILSAVPTIGTVREKLQPEVIQQEIEFAVDMYEQNGSLEALENQGVSREDIIDTMNWAMPLYFEILPALAGIMGIAEFAIVYFIFQNFYSDRRREKLPFARWRIPWYAVYGAIIGLASYLLGDYLGLNTIRIIGMNILVLYALVSFILGLSCLSFLFLSPRLPRISIILVFIIAVFYLELFAAVLAVVGLFDMVMDFRKLEVSTKGEGTK